jgi:dynein heavy chain
MEFDIDKSDWNNGSFLKLQFIVIEKKVNQQYFRECAKLVKLFTDANEDTPAMVAREMKQDVEKFREKLWMIELLTTEAMIKKPAHWKDIFKEC